jgi:SAM-dependent methyltransferase
MLTDFAHWIASQPFLYELIQFAAGRRQTIRRLDRVLATMPRTSALDVGSSSGGAIRNILPRAVSIDVDYAALAVLKRSRVDARPVAASAAMLPFRERAFEVTVCMAVFHHLDDATMHAALAEIARVTADRFVFIDALRNERRWLSRLLWRYDRGRHPRTREELLRAIEQAFDVESASSYRSGHELMVCVALPRRQNP